MLLRPALLTLAVLAALLTNPLTPTPAHAYEHRNYMALGDSITQGVGTSDMATKSYPNQASIRSIGVGGSCLSDWCGSNFRNEVLPRLLALPDRPSTVIINSGINDLGYGITATDLIMWAKDVRRELRNRGFRVVFSTIVPSPAGSCWTYCVGTFSPNGTTIQANRLVYNDWVRTEGPTFVDYAKALQCQQVQCPGLSNSNDMHVNDAGAAIMADVLRAWVARDSA